MDLSTWFHWMFPSPGYLLLALAGLLVFFGLIGGLTDTRKFGDAHNPASGEDEPHSRKAWWQQDEEHYREWNAHQVREHHRIAGKHSALD
jgi:hypothetical protein